MKAGTWMGARPGPATPEACALFGCTMAPGFDYADYEPGMIVFLAPEVRHAITAAPDSALEFYAVSTPAFSPDDYVPVKE